MKILLAEDTADLNKVVSAALEHEGFMWIHAWMDRMLLTMRYQKAMMP